MKIVSIGLASALLQLSHIALTVAGTDATTRVAIRSSTRKLAHHGDTMSDEGHTIFSQTDGDSSKSSKASVHPRQHHYKSSKSPSPSSSMKSTKSESSSKGDDSGSSSKKSSKSAKSGEAKEDPSLSKTDAPVKPTTLAPTPVPGPSISGSRTGAPRPPTSISTHAPVPPPTATTAAPNEPPVVSPPGSGGGGGVTLQPTVPEGIRTVVLDRYAIAYTIPSGLPSPTRQNFDELAIVTESFLDDFMIDAFDMTSIATFLSIMVDFVTSSTTNGVTVVYDSSANFTESSDEALTNPNSLKTTLQGAFEDQSATDYINFLRANLPSSNPFSRTTSVSNTAIVTPSSTGRSGSPKSGSTTQSAIIAGASAIIVMTAGVILLRRRVREDEDGIEYTGKPLGKLGGMEGDVTVAGETYTGETFASSPSYMRDEEQGNMVNVDLGSPTDAYDSSSVAPVLGDEDSVVDRASSRFRVAPIMEAFEDEYGEDEQTPSDDSGRTGAFGPTLMHPRSHSHQDTTPTPYPETGLDSDRSAESHVQDTGVSTTDSTSTSDSHGSFHTVSEGDEQVKRDSNADDDDDGDDGDDDGDDSSNAAMKEFHQFLLETRQMTQASIHHDDFQEGESVVSESNSFMHESSARRPMTVAEIESLLSQELADDMHSIDGDDDDDISLSELSAALSPHELS